MPRIITRYIIKELAVPFLLASAVIVAVMMIGGALRLADLFWSGGAGAKYAALFIISAVPAAFVYALPAAVLAATLVACTRLSSDNEITAMKSAGISMSSVVMPVFLFAAAVSAIMLVSTLYLSPWGNRNLAALAIEAVKANASSGISEKVFYDKFKGSTIYVDRITPDGAEMSGIFIFEGSPSGARVITASGGKFSSSAETGAVMLTLSDGEIHAVSKDSMTYHRVGFGAYTAAMRVEEQSLGVMTRAPRELFLDELMERARIYREVNKVAYRIETHIHKRFSIPVSVFALALIAVPLGLQRVRSARLTGFGLAALVLLVYYVTGKVFDSLGSAGLVSAAVSSWAAEALIGAAGVYLFVRAAKDKPVPVLNLLEKTFDAAGSLAKKIYGGKR